MEIKKENVINAYKAGNNSAKKALLMELWADFSPIRR